MTYKIDRLGHQGDGIASGPVFASRTLPGEVVDGTLDGQSLTAIRIVEPSDTRVKAPCRVYNSCGGCALQHAEDGFVAEWKQQVVRHALEARDIPAPMRAVHTSPLQSRRRATLTGRRTKSGALVGFHARQSATITDADACQVMTPALTALLPALREVTLRLGSRKGELRFAVTEAQNGIDLAIDGSKSIDAMEGQSLAQWALANGIVRISVNGELVAEETPPVMRFGAALVPFSPGGFLQATAHGQEVLTAAVKEALGGAGAVIDLFAGCGTFSIPAAEQAEVFAVEAERDLLNAAEAGWRQAKGLRAMRFEQRDLFRNPVLPEDLKTFDAAIIDPPRAGAETQSQALAASEVNRVAAISCNPVTFARDAQIFIAAGFTLNWVDVVDQFRWSPHVELAAEFTRD